VRTAWVFSPRGNNFLLTMLRLGAERDELRVVDDQIGCPTAAVHLARATMELVERCAPGTYNLAGGGSTSWHGFASAIIAAAGLTARVEPISSSELQRPAPRPACSILRPVHADAPRLPHWRDGLRDCLAALANPEET
jgi:dTDP-4-dehydrorhamnose reductase